MAASALHDLAAIVDDLDAGGRLARVKDEVALEHDLAGIAHRLEGGARAVLFEKVRGHAFPVLTGLYWSRELLAGLLGRDERELAQYVSACIRSWQDRPVEPVEVKSGPVLEMTERDVDLGRIPVPVHALKDGGAYFDAAVAIARDPETGVRNASIQRFMIAGRNRLVVNIDAGRHLEAYLEKAKARRQSLFLTLNCGVGPGLHFAAAAPAEAAPIERDELGIASAFDGRPLELVAGTISNVEMAAHAMWALECEMIPGETAPEGPFAEVTGYYAPRGPRPVVHVRRVHRRAAPIFHTILSGKEVWNSVGLLGEANVLALLQRQVPGVQDVYFSHGGGGFYHAVVAIRQKRGGWSKQAILAAFAAFPPLKMVTVVDDDVDIRSATDVEWAMATRLDPRHGIVTIDRAFGHGLNPSFPDYVGAKIGFDATQPFPRRPDYERASYKPMALDRLRIERREVTPSARRVRETAAPLAAASADWNENRWVEREIAEWRRGDSGKPAAVARQAAAPDDDDAMQPGADGDGLRGLDRDIADWKRSRAAGPRPAAGPAGGKPAITREMLIDDEADDDDARWGGVGRIRPKPAAPPAPESARPAPGTDWNEGRWVDRELADWAKSKEERKKKAVEKRVAAEIRDHARKTAAPKPAKPGAEDEEDGFFKSGGT